jgi:hypothetical protein
VGVHVDEAGRDQLAAGVDLAAAATDVTTDGSDAVAVDGHVGLDALGAGAVEHRAPPDHEIVHGRQRKGRRDRASSGYANARSHARAAGPCRRSGRWHDGC